MYDNLNGNVGIFINSNAKYPSKEELFRPSKRYIEFSKSAFQTYSANSNEVYDSVRESFAMMGYDKLNYGTENWNPLSEFIKPGNTVLIKPNMVTHRNMQGSTECLYTHPSVVAPVVDYCVLALMEDGVVRGKIVIGDAPMNGCVFETLIKESGYSQLIKYYSDKGITISLVDFRDNVSNGLGVEVELNDRSNFSEFSSEKISKLRVTNYDPRKISMYHNERKHSYVVSDYMLASDVIINMPKPKTHRKAGMTASLKNMVGICVQKECLPHHTLGSKEEGGDEYKERSSLLKLQARIIDGLNIAKANNYMYIRKVLSNFYNLIAAWNVRFGKNSYSEGSWFGNDTIWRTIYDLNKIVFYASKDGILKNTVQRKMLIVADMIVAGEKDGPLAPTDKYCGIIAVGSNPVSFDEYICALMGFDSINIPSVSHLHDEGKGLGELCNLAKDSVCISNGKNWDGGSIFDVRMHSLEFCPNPHWIRNEE